MAKFTWTFYEGMSDLYRMSMSTSGHEGEINATSRTAWPVFGEYSPPHRDEILPQFNYIDTALISQCTCRHHYCLHKGKTSYLHHANMSVCWRPPYTPLLGRRTGIYRGVHYLFTCSSKHRLWLLAKISFWMSYRSNAVSAIFVLSINNIIKIFHLKISVFLPLRIAA